MDAIPEQLRKALYLVLFVAGVTVGALNVADVNTGKAVDVIAYLGTALGLVAAGNVGKAPKRGEDGVSDFAFSVWMAALIVALCVIFL